MTGHYKGSHESRCRVTNPIIKHCLSKFVLVLLKTMHQNHCKTCKHDLLWSDQTQLKILEGFCTPGSVLGMKWYMYVSNGAAVWNNSNNFCPKSNNSGTVISCTSSTKCRRVAPQLQYDLQAGDWSKIKMSSYQYRKSRCWDKTVVRSSRFLTSFGNPIVEIRRS